MTPALSPNTQAILLLAAPLIAGRDTPASDLLTPGEYKRLARHLRERQWQPADLVAPEADELLHACRHVIDEDRLRRLLGRGFLLSQAVERWQARAIWVVSRADAGYPRRLKTRLKEDAPAVLYGCGDPGLLETGGLAVVGSRHVDDGLIGYTLSVGRLAARANRTLISGGAKGIDLAAMQGALEAGGNACGVLADSLERTTMNREQRNRLLEGRLTLVSPYDPGAGFNVGNAMQRNKLIYALADAALVVSADVEKGGTWAGAVEQLDKLRFVPVHVRSTGDASAGLDALRKRGALDWPDPADVDAFDAVFSASPFVSEASAQGGLTLSIGNGFAESPLVTPKPPDSTGFTRPESNLAAAADEQAEEPSSGAPSPATPPEPATRDVGPAPAEALFAAVRLSIRQLLTVPMKDADVATALDVSPAQAKAWLHRLVDEGILEKQKKPAGYIVKQRRLFE